MVACTVMPLLLPHEGNSKIVFLNSEISDCASRVKMTLGKLRCMKTEEKVGF